MNANQYMDLAEEAIRKKQPGPAHRHLTRAFDQGSPLTDVQLDRWAKLSDRLDPVEKEAGMHWGMPIGWEPPADGQG